MAATDLIVPATPANFRRYGNTPITSDVYHICERLREIDPSLYVYPLDPPVGDKHFSIVEKCRDGVERLVFRAPALDGRIIEHVEYLLHVPFERRFKEAEALADKLDAEAREQEMNEFVEAQAGPMWTELERCGFIQRGVSYPKRGIKR